MVLLTFLLRLLNIENVFPALLSKHKGLPSPSSEVWRIRHFRDSLSWSCRFAVVSSPQALLPFWSLLAYHLLWLQVKIFFPCRICLLCPNRFKASPKQDAFAPFPLPEFQCCYASIRLLRLPRFGLPSASALRLQEATWIRMLTLGQPKTSHSSLNQPFTSSPPSIR